MLRKFLIAPVLAASALSLAAHANSQDQAATATAGAAPVVARSGAESADPVAQAKAIERQYDKLLSEGGKSRFTGAVLTIVADGKIVTLKGYGRTGARDSKAVDPATTRWRVASVSKTVIGSLAGIAIDRGKIESLDAKANDYFNGFVLPPNNGQEITLRMLATHTAGFAENRQPFRRPGSKQQVIDSDYLEQMRPPYIRPPNTGSNYSNYASTLLGIAAADALGGDYFTLTDELVFKPLGMDHTRYELEPTPPANIAIAESFYPDGTKRKVPANWSQNPVVAPAGGVVTTAGDMGRYMIALLGGSESLGIPPLHSDQTRELMFSPQGGTHPMLQQYGMLFMLHEWNGHKVVDHGGRTLANTSYLQLLPEQNIGVFVSVTGENGTFVPMASSLLGKSWPQQSSPTIELAKAPGLYDFRATAPETLFGKWQPPQPIAQGHAPLSDYVGLYRGERRSVRPVDGFFKQIVRGPRDLEIVQTGKDTLRIGWADGYRQIRPDAFYRDPDLTDTPSGWFDLYVFSRDASGKVVSGSWAYTDAVYQKVSFLQSSNFATGSLRWSGVVLLSGLLALFWPKGYGQLGGVGVRWPVFAMPFLLLTALLVAFRVWPNAPVESLSFVWLSAEDLVPLQIYLNAICLTALVITVWLIMAWRLDSSDGWRAVFAKLHSMILLSAMPFFVFGAWELGWIGWNIS